MKNRILKIAFFLPTLNVGGIERVFITYANSLSEFYDVEFVLCKKEGILLKELSSKVNVYNLGNVRLANSFYYCIYNHRTTKTNQKYPSVNL